MAALEPAPADVLQEKDAAAEAKKAEPVAVDEEEGEESGPEEAAEGEGGEGAAGAAKKKKSG